MNPPGLVVAGSAVILTGDWVQTTLQAVLIATRSRRHNGLPNNAAHTELAQALADAMAANGRADVPEPVDVQRFPAELPTVTVDDAAQQFGLSRRQARRLVVWFVSSSGVVARRWGRRGRARRRNRELLLGFRRTRRWAGLSLRTCRCWRGGSQSPIGWLIRRSATA